MKFLNTRLLEPNSIQQMLPLLFFILLFFFTACEDEEVSDQRSPIIEVNGIVQGDTLVMGWSEEGNSFDMVISDDAGISGYTVEIDSLGESAFSYSSPALAHKLEHETVQLSGLATDFTYVVEIVVNDVSGKTSSFDFSLELRSAAPPPYDYLALVGDGSAAGWSPASTVAKFTQDDEDPYIFTYTGPLSASGEGAFKIHTVEADWCEGDWLLAPSANHPITTSGYTAYTGCPPGEEDFKWAVTAETAGNYTVTVNLREETIMFEKGEGTVEPPPPPPAIEYLGLLGDATEVGYNIASPAAMTMDSENSSIFTYEGPLTAGKLKIATFSGDWCDGKWINAAEADQPLTNPAFIFTTGCDGPDNQWVVDDAAVGNYLITVNLVEETVVFEKK